MTISKRLLLLSVTTFTAIVSIGCVARTSHDDDEGSANADENAARRRDDEGSGGGGTSGGPRRDAGPDTQPDAKPDTSPKVTLRSGASTSSMAPGGESCSPQRFDLMLSNTTSTHNCASLAKVLPSGTWTSSPIFDVEGLREKACYVIWNPVGPTCIAPPIDELAITCLEKKTLVPRAAACITNPASCIAHPPNFSEGDFPAREDLSCSTSEPPPGSLFKWVGGCSSCGWSYDGMVYGYNPWGPGEIGVNHWTGTSEPSIGYQVVVPSGPFMVAIPSLASGQVFISH